MKRSSYIIYTYCVILLLGGVFGYLYAGSLKSLLTGSAGAISLFLLEKDICSKINKLKVGISLTLILVFTFVFFMRWMVTGAWIPSGLLSLISLSVLVFVFINRIKMLKNNRRS